MLSRAKTTDSSHSSTLQSQLNFDELLSEGLVKIQHGLLGPKDFPNSKFDSDFSAKYTNDCLQKHRSMYHSMAMQTMELIRDILYRTEPRGDDTRIYTLELKPLTAVPPHANTDMECEHLEENLKASRNSYHLKNCSDHLDVKPAVSVSSSEKEFNLKGMQSEFISVSKEKLRRKDTENEHIVQLLLLKQHELIEVLKLRDVEAQLMTERLKYEEKQNVEMTKKFNHAFESMKKQFSIARSKNEHFAKQLMAILEKYERLKRRTDSIKKQLAEERREKKNCQKALKKSQQMTEEFSTNQALLEEQRNAARQENFEFRKSIKTMEEQHHEIVRTIQRLEDERSSMKADYGNLKDQLSNIQRERLKLNEALHSKELEKNQTEKQVEETRMLVNQLHEELEKSKQQRDTAEEQLNTMRKEFKLVHDRYKVRTLHIQEQHKSCMEQLEAKSSECEALSDDVSRLEKDKLLIQEELKSLEKEKAKSETQSKKQGERMKEAVRLLEHERKLLLDEMGDLRKDYFSLSDRITHRLEQLEQTDAPMCITDISPSHQIRTAKTNYPVGQIASDVDMIEHIRRKLEEEENT